MTKVTKIFLITLSIGFFSCQTSLPEEVEWAMDHLPNEIDFNYHVKPILSDRCFACHGPDDKAREADLRLDIEEEAIAALKEGKGFAIVKGNPQKSVVVHRILRIEDEEQMPPPESNLSLNAQEKAILIKWIDQGADYKDHWSFIPPERPAFPKTKNENWAKNGIDPFILQKLEEQGIHPSKKADKETLIRRVTFDLTGLPPSLEEIDEFLADDSSNAFEKVVDRLLSSVHYGERMAVEWLDLARYADSHGYQDDGMRTMWPWRDWVIQAFNRNIPFDQFITWQLAGDLLAEPSKPQVLATAFNRNHMQTQEGGVVPEEYRVEYVVDRTRTLGRAFLGLTIECAQCHDHKYDPITQKEYFELYSFFNNNNETGQIPYAGEAAPALVLTDEKTDSTIAFLHAKMDKIQPKIALKQYEADFEAWVNKVKNSEVKLPDQPLGLIGHYPLDNAKGKDRVLQNLEQSQKPAKIQLGLSEELPITVEGKKANGQRLVGDSFINMGKGLAFFERNEPFSVSLWVKIEEDSTHGPIFSRSGGLFNGNRGYECLLNKDRSLSVSLNHVFPHDGIEVLTKKKLLQGEWTHIAMTYDGSSKAKGVHIFLNGEQVELELINDRLTQSMIHIQKDNNWGGHSNFLLGRRFDETLEGVVVDECRIYEKELNPLEVKWDHSNKNLIQEIIKREIPAWTPEQYQQLLSYYVQNVNPKYQEAFEQLTTLRGEENDILTEQNSVMVMGEQKTLRPTYVLNRGAYDQPTTPVSPKTPQTILAFDQTFSPDRMGLSQWLTHPDHPLTARVMVNRLWQMMFGKGLVLTPDDFGSQGELPSHPELLDWLAISFKENGWDTKAFLKMVALSSTYQQSSSASDELLEKDLGNNLYSRGPGYRLPAEMIRDLALASSGLLVRDIGGPSVKPYQPPGLWKQLATRNETLYIQDHGDSLYRRSMYTVWKRTSPPPSMMSFDTPERNFCEVKRQKTSTPLQALVLLNDPQYVEAARILAERMMKEGGNTIDERIHFGFRLLSSRSPFESESKLLAKLFSQELVTFQNDPTEAEKLLAIGEYPRDPKLNTEEVAAYTMVASTIMNFDQVVFKR